MEWCRRESVTLGVGAARELLELGDAELDGAICEVVSQYEAGMDLLVELVESRGLAAAAARLTNHPRACVDLSAGTRRRVFDILAGARRRSAYSAAEHLEGRDVTDLVAHRPNRAAHYVAALWYAVWRGGDAEAARAVLTLVHDESDAVAVARFVCGELGNPLLAPEEIVRTAREHGWGRALVRALRKEKRRDGWVTPAVLAELEAIGAERDDDRADAGALARLPVSAQEEFAPEVFGALVERPFEDRLALASVVADSERLARSLLAEAAGRRGAVVTALAAWSFVGIGRDVATRYVELVLANARALGTEVGAILVDRFVHGPYRGPWLADQLVELVGWYEERGEGDEDEFRWWWPLAGALRATPGSDNYVGDEAPDLIERITGAATTPASKAAVVRALATTRIPTDSTLWATRISRMSWPELRERGVASDEITRSLDAILGPLEGARAERFVALESTWRGTLGELADVLATMDEGRALAR